MLGEDYSEIARVIEGVTKRMAKYLALNEDVKKYCGYFIEMSIRSQSVERGYAAIAITFPINTKSIKQMSRDFVIAHERANRLFNNPDNISSWQSRDSESNRGGGAIRLQGSANRNSILSFSSGFPELELADEAVMLQSALELEWIDLAHAEKIADLSNNPYFGRI